MEILFWTIFICFLRALTTTVHFWVHDDTVLDYTSKTAVISVIAVSNTEVKSGGRQTKMGCVYFQYCVMCCRVGVSVAGGGCIETKQEVGERE